MKRLTAMMRFRVGETAIPADKQNMKRVIAITAALVVACSSMASAQSQAPSLADVAKKEEERRKTVRKPSKVYTNSTLATPDHVTSAPPSTTAAASASGNASPPSTTPGRPAAEGKPGDVKDQAYWASRMAKARDDLRRIQMFGDALQTRINSLRTDFVNRDNRVEREKIEQDLNAALAELERVKKDIEAGQKAIAAIEDEARRANVPSGWLRSPE